MGKQTYLVKTADGYILAVEGNDDVHITNATDPETISQIKGLLKDRAAAGVKLSKLFKQKYGLTAMSISLATHTTGAGDYDDQKSQKKRKKK